MWGEKQEYVAQKRKVQMHWQIILSTFQYDEKILKKKPIIIPNQFANNESQKLDENYQREERMLEGIVEQAKIHLGL